jgi:hypothetical protein
MPEERRPIEPETIEADLDEAAEVGGEGARRFVTDAVRKAFLAGVGALFMTEEGARRLAREWKLPKEVLGFVTAQAAGAKDEVLRVVSDEVRKFFESEALRREFLKLLGSMSIEIRAEIRLKDAGGGRTKLHVHRATVKPKVSAKGGAAEDEPGAEPEAVE